MKQFSLLLITLFLGISQLFAVNSENWKREIAKDPAMNPVAELAAHMNLQEFLNLTPAQFRKYTGERLGLKNVVALKAAQKTIKKSMNKDSDISKGVYILLAFLGLGWLAMGLLSDFDGEDWIINLVLTALCWLPGLIHAFVKMDDYY